MENNDLRILNGIAKKLDTSNSLKVMPSMEKALKQIEQALTSLTSGIAELENKIAELEKSKSINVSDITALTDDQLDALLPGNKVVKETGTATHVYTVSYKDEENGGICLTYTDASVVETVSYDHTESGWAYNSTDVTPISSGGGGGLAPMTVHGSFDENDAFVPDEGEPTFEEALAAYCAGSVVRLGYTDSDFGPCLVEVKAAYSGDSKSIIAGDSSTMVVVWAPTE